MQSIPGWPKFFTRVANEQADIKGLHNHPWTFSFQGAPSHCLPLQVEYESPRRGKTFHSGIHLNFSHFSYIGLFRPGNNHLAQKPKQTFASFKKHPSHRFSNIHVPFCGHPFICCFLGVIPLVLNNSLYRYINNIYKTLPTQQSRPGEGSKTVVKCHRIHQQAAFPTTQKSALSSMSLVYSLACPISILSASC